MPRKRTSPALEDDSALASPTEGSTSKRVRLEASTSRDRVSTSDSTTENHSGPLKVDALSEDEDAMILDEDDDEEDEMLRSGKQQVKKRKLGGEPDDEASAGEDEDSPDDEEEDELDDDEYERQAAEDWKNRRDQPREGVIGEMAQHGIVEEITLHDFMVHEHFNIKLEPYINFVCGANGSGKSAVLTALLIGLGNKAAMTGRAQGLKQFIRDGANSAEIIIRLKNQGDGAWRPDDYGKSIQIKRTITAAGGSSYKIMSHRGDLVSAKAIELTAILEHFNIFIDNPIVVLGQDATKEFLSVSKPADKYRLFLKGTMLMTLQDEYHVLHGITKTVKRNLKRISEDLPELKEAYKAAQATYNEVQEARNLAGREQQTRIELTWALVAEDEKKLVEEEEAKAKYEKKIARYDQGLDHLETGRVTAENELRDFEVKLAEVDATEDADAVELRELEKELKETRGKMQRNVADKRAMNKAFQDNREALESVIQQIEAHEDEAAKRSNNGKAAQLQIEKTQLSAQRHDLAQVVHNHKQSFEGQKDSVAAKKAELGRAQDDLERQKAEVARINSQLANASNLRSDPLSRFHARTRAVIDAIQRYNGWHGTKPIGPLGSFIKIDGKLDRRWHPVIETIFERSLNHYLVFSPDDVRPMQQLLRQAKVDNTDVYCLGQAFDRPKVAPDPRFTWLLDVLQISDNRVTSILINVARIDGAMLVEETMAGDELMKHEAELKASMRVAPKNNLTCYSLDAYRVGGNRGGFQRVAMNVWRGPPRLTADQEAWLQSLQQSKAESEQKLQRMNQQVRDLNAALQELYNGEQTAKHDAESKRRTMTTMDRRIRAIEDELSELARQADIDVSGLIEERKRFEEEKADIENQFKANTEQAATLSAENAPRVRRKEELEKRARDALRRRQAQQADIETSNGKLGQIHSEIDKRKKAKATAEAEIEKINKTIAELEDQLQRAVEAAERNGPRDQVTLTKSIDEYKRELSRLRDAINAERRKTGKTIDEATADLEQAQKEYQEVRATRKSLSTAHDALKQAYAIRSAKWMDFRRLLSRECKYRFQELVSRRGFEGHLSFDHNRDGGKLVIRVRGADAVAEDGTASQRVAKDVKTLSGGEKSYSTVCFLVTLWEVFDCPIRALDEFDVYMDPINRRSAVKLLTEAAQATNETQHIFISPNSQQFSASRTAKIHELAPPERVANTLRNPRYSITATGRNDEDDE